MGMNLDWTDPGVRRMLAEGRITEGGKPVGADPAPCPPVAGEKDFQSKVIALADLHGWRHYHTHDSRRSDPGFPDLVLVRERVVWVELKVEPNKPTAAQREWLAALKAAGQEVYLAYPADWPLLVEVLTCRR